MSGHAQRGPAMPMFEITHAVELTITHRVEADTPEEAYGIAVEMTLERTRQLEQQHRDLGFGSVDDHYAPPKPIER
jgi:hypothetical protein